MTFRNASLPRGPASQRPQARVLDVPVVEPGEYPLTRLVHIGAELVRRLFHDETHANRFALFGVALIGVYGLCAHFHERS